MGNQIALEGLILQNADLNIQDAQLNTPLHIAISEMRDDIAGKLIVVNAKTNLVNAEGDTPLHLYAKGVPQRGVTLLTNYEGPLGRNIAVHNNQNETPLHCAVAADNMYFFTYFVHPLQRRYYSQVDLRHPNFLHGPNP